MIFLTCKDTDILPHTKLFYIFAVELNNYPVLYYEENSNHSCFHTICHHA